MQLSRLVETSTQVAATRSRLKKTALLSALLREAEGHEVRLAVDYLSGSLPQGRIGLGPALLRDITASVESSAVASLSLQAVNGSFQQVAETVGAGSRQRRIDILSELFRAATPEEQAFLCRLVLGELRQGALEGVLIEGIAEASSLPSDAIRRAVMLAGSASPVAEAALTEGEGGLEQFRLVPLSPVRPMLAQPAEGIAEALQELGQASLEYKLDGARVQVHRVGGDVRIYTRALNDVTESLPEIVEAALALPVESLILDGEAIALRADGRPLPFQVTMRRFGRKIDVDALRDSLPMSVFYFDALHWDGTDLIDLPLDQRLAHIGGGIDDAQQVPRLVTDVDSDASRFLVGALEKGHEGIMAKSLVSPYAAGNRGAGWLKIKQAHTLDLVVLAAEWGSGRRKGWLSNLHLGARDPATGGFVMLGKTFKGLTDKVLKWQTEALLERELGREDHIVHVRPELVVEIAVNDIQASSQYPGGMALRFARVKRYRDDKTPAEADTVDAVRTLFNATQ